MKYYTFSTIIFADGKIKDANNFIREYPRSATVVDFIKYLEGNYAGDPLSYSKITIPCWEEISEETYKNMEAGFVKMNEDKKRND